MVLWTVVVQQPQRSMNWMKTKKKNARVVEKQQICARLFVCSRPLGEFSQVE